MTLGCRCLIDPGFYGNGCPTNARRSCTTVSQELELFENYLHSAALFLRVLVLPLVQAETAFNIERASFHHVLSYGFTLFPPRFHVDIDDFLSRLARLHLKLTINRQRELANRCALGSNPQLRVAGQVPH